MTGSIAIDVALGLCFIFLLYSLLASIIQEIFSVWLGLRGHMLMKAIARMLDDDHGFSHEHNGRKWYGTLGDRISTYFLVIRQNLTHYFIDSFHQRKFTKEFYMHPTIKYFGENNWSRNPAYLSASAFSKTLVDILRGKDYDGTQDQMELIKRTLNEDLLNFGENSDTRRQLRIFLAESKGDVGRYKSLIEEWYNETMERCTDWFKRQTQFILFLIGLGLAATFNVDALGIIKILANDTKAREQLVSLASATYKEYEPMTRNEGNAGTQKPSPEVLEKAYNEVTKSINESSSILGLGWGSSCSLAAYQPSVASMILGWSITAFAISLGAAFWFDLLNKIMMLRAGKRTEGNDSQAAGKTTTIRRAG